MAAIADIASSDAVGSVELRRALKRSERRDQLRAAALVVPLFAFLLASFIVPIGAMLARGIFDSEVAQILPRVTRELRQWDGRDLPSDAAFAAMVADLRAAREAGTLASAATRLNYDVAGFRTLMFTSARRVANESIEAPRAALLAALDLRHDADNAITAAPADQSVFRSVLGRTLWISGVVTLACLLLGYPVALYIARAPPSRAPLLLFLVLLPFWTSLLVRTVAWVVLLQREGILNNLLISLGLVSEPIRMIFNRFAVYVAMVHVLLPFMVLPLYAVMKGISPSYVRAASSLGATPWTAFRRVYLPQTLPGIGAGCLMVFIQALGYYITPALVGGADDQMISYFIAFYASRTVNWGMAAALSIILLTATLALYAVYDRLVGLDKMRMA